MSTARQPLRRVVVAGDGALGVLAAIGVRQSLPDCEVVVLGWPVDSAAPLDAMSGGTWFSLALMETLGIAEHMLLARAGASHRLVTRLFDFAAPGSHAVFACDGASAEPEGRFAQDWGRTVLPGGEETPAASLAEALADAGRFAPTGSIPHSLRWHEGAFRALLVNLAQARGIVHVAGNIARMEWAPAGTLSALVLDNGQSLGGDLFIDCTGSAARLRAELSPGVAPARQPILVYRAAPGSALLALEDRITRTPAGLLVERAGRDAMTSTLIAQPGASDIEVAAALGARPVGFSTKVRGRVGDPWHGNVVALGPAAVRTLPLLDLDADLACRQLELLLDMLPGRDMQPRERAEYNRRTAAMADAVLDIEDALLHALPSPRLGVALDRLARHGTLPFWEDAPLETAELASLFAAAGHARGELVHRAAPGDGAVAAYRSRLAQAVAAAPPYAEWLRSTLSGG